MKPVFPEELSVAAEGGKLSVVFSGIKGPAMMNLSLIELPSGIALVANGESIPVLQTGAIYNQYGLADLFQSRVFNAGEWTVTLTWEAD